MRVLVNAASVKEGGSRVVLDYLLRGMCQLRGDIKWFIAAHPSIRLRGCEQQNVVWLNIRDIGQNPFGVMYWYEVALPAAVESAPYFAALVTSSFTSRARLVIADSETGQSSPEIEMRGVCPPIEGSDDGSDQRLLRRSDRLPILGP